MSTHEGINLIGFFTGNFGLSVYIRHIARLLKSKGIPFSIINVGVPGRDTDRKDYEEFENLFTEDPIYPTNLFVFGADFSIQFYFQLKEKTKMSERYNILLPFWELNEYGDAFLNLNKTIDMFIAPTSFIKYSLIRAMPNSRVEYLEPSVQVLDKSCYPEYRKNKKFKFYYNFDIGSSFQRKNPMPLITAFRELFNGNNDVELVLKIGSCNQEAEMFFKQHGGPNCAIYTRHLSYSDNIRLLNSSDCYVSTHRSEGLGQGLYEAMMLGIPTISTGFGGNMDFMDHGSSYILKHSLVSVECPLYKNISNRLGTWAEVDKEDLKRGMKLMYTNSEYRNTIANNGLKKVKDIDSRFWNTDVFDSIERMRILN